MRRLALALAALLLVVSAAAQTDRREVRQGNAKFRKDKFKEAEIDYRRAVLKDSLSVAGEYNLASSLYRQEDYDGALAALEKIKDVAAESPHAARYHYNRGDVALQKEDYASAVEAFREALLLTPGDMDAKENYIYAKMKLQEQQNQDQNQNQDQQDQNQDQNQNQDKDQQNQDQNQDQQDQNQDQDQKQNQDQQQEPKISPQQAQQMLRAIQAKEKDTQDKVNREKAALLKSRQKEKNW